MASVNLVQGGRDLQAAVKKGVMLGEDNDFQFFDPGVPLVILRDLPVVREQKLIYPQDWYDEYEWATRADAPQERCLHLPVPESFGKTFAEQ
jgi:hypothetical protein